MHLMPSELPSPRGVDLYLDLRSRLMAARKQAGGKLPHEEEARWATDLESVWVELSEPERERIESS